MTREEILEYAEAKKAKLQARMGSPESMYGDYAIYSPEFEFVSAALAAIREQEERDNRLESDAVKIDPLTLDELRQMDGEPYYHVGLQADSQDPHWAILDSFVARQPEDYGYGKRWLAYRSKPKEDSK